MLLLANRKNLQLLVFLNERNHYFSVAFRFVSEEPWCYHQHLYHYIMDGVIMATRRELLTWEEVSKLVDHLIPQFDVEFDAMVIITHGGIVPGGLLCEALDVQVVLTAAVDFPFEAELNAAKLLAWPEFIQFPESELLKGKRVLVVDDVWGSGRTITAVKNRISAAGGRPYTCVLHFNPYRSLFSQAKPDFYAAITDAYILYPWEIERGSDKVLLDTPE